MRVKISTDEFGEGGGTGGGHTVQPITQLSDEKTDCLNFMFKQCKACPTRKCFKMYPVCSKTTFVKRLGQVLWKGRDEIGLRERSGPSCTQGGKRLNEGLKGKCL